MSFGQLPGNSIRLESEAGRKVEEWLGQGCTAEQTGLDFHETHQSCHRL